MVQDFLVILFVNEEDQSSEIFFLFILAALSFLFFFPLLTDSISLNVLQMLFSCRLVEKYEYILSQVRSTSKLPKLALEFSMHWNLE